MFPVLFFGFGTVCAIQEALGFGDLVRDVLLALLLSATLFIDDRYGPRAAQREREGRR